MSQENKRKKKKKKDLLARATVQITTQKEEKKNKSYHIKSRLCNLSLGFPLRLALLPVALLQAHHPGLAHLRIAGIERLEIVGSNNGRDLHFGGFVVAVFVGRLAFRVWVPGLAVRRADEDGARRKSCR